MPSRETFAYRRALKLRAQRAVDESGNDSAVDNVFSRAQNDFATFCTLMDKPPAQHMLQWHRELVTGESNRYLLDIAGPNTDILSPRGPLDPNTLVATPTGWTPLHAIEIGDTVYGDDGSAATVVDTLDYEETELFEVVFSDGTTMRCDDSHKIDCRRIGTDAKGTFKTRTLQELRCFVTTGVSGNWRTGVKRITRMATPGETPWLDTRGYSRYQVPVTEPVKYPHRDFKVSPYIVGVLLGDGGLTDGTNITITTEDVDIIERVNAELSSDLVAVERAYESRKYSYVIQHINGNKAPIIDGRRGGVRKQIVMDLQDLGMMGKGALEKSIPKEYLLGSIEQRVALLQGLMDTDGTRMNRNNKDKSDSGFGGLGFGSSSPQLIEGVTELVQSLGGIALPGKPYYPHYYTTDEAGNKVKIVSKNLTYRIGIRLPEGIAPFHCQRKASTYLGPASQRSNSTNVRSIVDIRSVGRSSVRCIEVDNPQHRFLIKNYVVSNNSAKSTCLNLFTAWCIGRHTAAQRPLQIIYVSYNVATAIPKSRIIKQIVDSATFKKIFPTCRLKPGMQSDIGWSIDFEYAGIPRVGDEEFTLRAAGLRGSITSKRAHLCLTGDASILTDRGEASIASIYRKPEDFRVAVRNATTHRIDWSHVGAVTRRSASEIIEIETTCGRRIRATAEHPFLTAKGGYKRAGDLSEREVLIGVSQGSLDSELSGLRRREKTHTTNLCKLLEESGSIPGSLSVSAVHKNVLCEFSSACTAIIEKPRGFDMFAQMWRGESSDSERNRMPVVHKAFSSVFPTHEVLFKNLCRTKPRQKNDGNDECELSTRKLCRGIQKTPTNSAKEGQFYLCWVQYEGAPVSVKRRIYPHQSMCSPHQSRSQRKFFVESDYAVPTVPRSSSPDYGPGWETLTISRITRTSTRKEYVYDLEVDHLDHNFIANGYVVSNCIVDDPIKSSTDIRNPAIREEQNSNWSSVIAPIIFEGGRSICLGTRFHPLDIHKTMFIPQKGWKQVVQEAITYNDAGEPISYWPEQWSVDYLLQQKELDPVAFAYQYQQQPVMTSDLVLSPDLIVKGEVVTEFDSLAVGIDLSASKNETSDYTAFVLGGRLKDKYYIIDSHQVRSIGNLEKIDLLCDMLVEWGILQLQDDQYFPTYSTVTLVVEAVAYQASLAADLRRVLLNERGLSNLHIHEVKGFRGDKVARFRGTLGLLENKKVIFNKYRKFDALTDQLVNIGATSHDDLLDAYTWLMTFLQKRGNFSIEY